MLTRSLTAAFAVVLVGGALTACTGPFDGGCAPAFAAGDASSIITASGEVGESPAVDFPTPLIAPEVQRSVLESGSGTPAAAGSTVVLDTVYYIGETGEVLSTGPSTLAMADDRSGGLGEALRCARPGSRIAIAGPAGEIDPQYAGNTETLVVVADVREVLLGKADGVNQLPQDGMPTVVTAVDGEPGITSTYLVAPAETRTATIKLGSGATIAADDIVVFHARSWSWTPGGRTTVGDIDSWAAARPYTLVPTAESMAGEQALADALVGAKVGSQVLVVIPGADETSAATVYLFDILGTLDQD